MKKVVAFLGSILVAISLFAGVASAHVTVQPKETTQGAYEVFTLRVPSEKENVSTTKIELEIPAEVNISPLEPKPGWNYELQKDTTEKIIRIIWTTTEDGLSSTEFGHFLMQGKVNEQAKQIVWKSYQTYQDGSIAEWVGAENAEKPASVTIVSSAANSTDSHGTATTEKTVETEEQVESVIGEAPSNSNVPMYVAIAALIVALLAFGMSLKKRG